MKINVNLSSKGITEALNKVRWYESYLQWKVEQLLSELAKVGIAEAKAHAYVEIDNVYTNLGDYILLETDVSKTVKGATCIITAMGKPLIKEWENGEAFINPLLMAEFGSGIWALDGRKGSFPSSTAKEHTDNPPWFWRDTSGNLHSSKGSIPSRPLLNAKQEMERKIYEVAERVFE